MRDPGFSSQDYTQAQQLRWNGWRYACRKSFVCNNPPQCFSSLHCLHVFHISQLKNIWLGHHCSQKWQHSHGTINCTICARRQCALLRRKWWCECFMSKWKWHFYDDQCAKCVVIDILWSNEHTTMAKRSWLTFTAVDTDVCVSIVDDRSDWTWKMAVVENGKQEWNTILPDGFNSSYLPVDGTEACLCLSRYASSSLRRTSHHANWTCSFPYR